MATCTKGFVLTPCKDAFFVCERIEWALNQLIRPRIQEEVRAGRGLTGNGFSSCQTTMHASSQAVRIQFTYEGETYMMTVNFTCDWDNREYGPTSISLSLGLRKEAQRFVLAALESLRLFGEVYYIADDSDDRAEPEVLQLEAPTYIQACAAGQVLGSSLSLRDWTLRLRRGEIVGGVGLGAEETQRILEMLYDESRLRIEEHVQAYKASQPVNTLASV